MAFNVAAWGDSMNNLARSLLCAIALGGALTLAGCGGGGGDSSSGDKPFGSDTTTGGTTGTTEPKPSWLTAIKTHIQTRTRLAE